LAKIPFFNKKVSRKPAVKYRPYPMATINLQKIGTAKLRLSSHRIMEIAEKLYTKGYISYPRTETDAFPPTINVQELISIQTSSASIGDYCRRLTNNDLFMHPKKGKHSDNSHPPIHPVKLLSKNEDGINQDE